VDAVRVAVAGAGILGRRHARVFHEIEGVRVVAVADPHPERAAAAAAPAGCATYSSMDALLASVECDVVAVATPDHRHASPVLASLAAGKHVLVEKPLATTLADAHAMIAEAARRGLVLQVNYSQRLVPEYAWMKERIDAGDIGAPVMFASSKQDTIHVPTRMISWAASTSPVWFMSSHDIDLVGWFLGERAASVQAHERRGVLQALGIDVHDGVDALVRYRSGATAAFHTSWIHPNSYPTLTVDRMTVLGETGVLEFQGASRRVDLYDARGGRSVAFTGPQTANEVDGRLEGAFRSSLLSFLDAVRGGPEPPTTAARTLHVTEIQAAILEAVSTGGTVRLGPSTKV
jgi:predicted dehydrogenase